MQMLDFIEHMIESGITDDQLSYESVVTNSLKNLCSMIININSEPIEHLKYVVIGIDGLRSRLAIIDLIGYDDSTGSYLYWDWSKWGRFRTPFYKEHYESQYPRCFLYELTPTDKMYLNVIKKLLEGDLKYV